MNSIRSVPHKKLPGFSLSTKRVSYKLFDIVQFKEATHEQSTVAFKEDALFSGSQELIANQLTAEDELWAAKRRKIWNTEQEHPVGRATTMANVITGEGEGRSTREIELIWWPDIFSVTNHGKLPIRFFIIKISLL